MTSASIEAYYHGFPIYSFLDPKKLNLNPLRNVDEITFINSQEQLKSTLINHDKWLQKNTKAINYFYLDLKLPRWKKLILNGSHD